MYGVQHATRKPLSSIHLDPSPPSAYPTQFTTHNLCVYTYVYSNKKFNPFTFTWGFINKEMYNKQNNIQ